MDTSNRLLATRIAELENEMANLRCQLMREKDADVRQLIIDLVEELDTRTKQLKREMQCL